MDPVTIALHQRINTNDQAYPSVTPIYQCSAFSAESQFFYSRKDNPNLAELEQVLCTLEGARHGLAVTCGMAAIYLVLDLVRPGQLVVLNTDLYGCSFKLFKRISERRGWRLQVLDLSKDADIERIPTDTALVFFETPTNPFLKTVHIRQVVDRVKNNNPDALVVVDNTWATPLFQHPLEHGADISLHSGTKYFSGHSDVMNGMILTDRDDLHERLREDRFYAGLMLSPENAWLVRRSMQTFALRMRHHQEVTKKIAEFLTDCPQIARVYYPRVDGEQLTGYGGILFVELRRDLVPRYKELTERLQIFNTGTGMACVTSMIAQPYTGSHASMSAEEKAAMGLDESLVRLCIGMENADDIKDDLLSALGQIDGGAAPPRDAI
ncbi:MAG: PLP-dependent aspartate aminotransferase family protein [Proteobacteria bacterium]|nr:PLP-dependent aspartate aminotransferase family protein [Pseudomonadota bacterium]